MNQDKKDTVSVLNIDMITEMLYEVENQGFNPEYLLPSYTCPNPNNLEPHYLWFSCLLRCWVPGDEFKC